MAEGFARELGKGKIMAASAGTEAHGLNPQAVAAMAEIGIDIASQKSKVIDQQMVAVADIIVTVCDRARENCPVAPGHVRQLHWSFDDPAKATGSPDEIRSVFCRVRDEIGGKVKELVESV